MKKKSNKWYLAVGIIAIILIIIGFAYLVYPEIVHQNICSELGSELNYEYKKLDFSCQKDEDCTSLGCSECINKNSYTGRYFELYNEYFRKNWCDKSFIDVTCIARPCKCLNNKCSFES